MASEKNLNDAALPLGNKASLTALILMTEAE